MTGLPVFPQHADGPDDGGYKGRRAEQDAGTAAPMAPDQLGGLASSADAPDPSGQPIVSVGQDTAFGGAGVHGAHPPGGSGGAPAADLGGAGGSPYDPIGQVGQVVQVGRVGQGADVPGPAGVVDGQPDGSGYALGAVYGPGSQSPTGGLAGPTDLPAGYTSPTEPDHTSLAGLGDPTVSVAPQAVAYPPSATAPSAPSPPMAPTAPPAAGPASAPPADPVGQPGAAPPVSDGVSFHPSNLDAMLSGQPVGPPTGTQAAGPGGDPQGVQVTVDDTVVSSGDGGVLVNLGRDGTTTVTPDPPTVAGHAGPGTGPAAPAGPAGSVPGQPGPPAGQQGTGQPGDPASQYVHGTGPDPANVQLTVDPATTAGVPVQVVRNADGSVDVHLPGAGAGGHDVDVHVAQGRDVDLTLTRDAHGDLLVHATPDVTGDNRTGGPTTGPGGPDGTGDPDRTGGADSAGGGGGPTAAGAAAPTGGPQVPTGGVPGGGGRPTGGVPGGGVPGGGLPGGGLPGGGLPGGPSTGGPPPRTGPGSAPGTGTVKADPQAISKLGSDLTDQAGPMLDSAHRKAGDISVSFPGFGVLGMPLNMAHDQVRQTAQSYLAAGRKQLDSWRTALNQTASNYRNAEDSSTISDG